MAADADLLDADLVIPALSTAMNDPQPETRRSVLLALSMYTTKSVPSVLAIAKAVDDSDVLVRISATHDLGHTRRDTEEASAAVTSALVRALKDHNRVVRISAAKALVRIGAGERAVPAMVELLREYSAEQRQHDRDFQRREAVEILESIGLGAKSAVPALVAAMRDDDAQVRVGAAAALVAVGETTLALPLLREVSDESNGDMTTKSVASRALQKIAPLPGPGETQPVSPEP
jgi:HEAT repeat protein